MFPEESRQYRPTILPFPRVTALKSVGTAMRPGNSCSGHLFTTARSVHVRLPDQRIPGHGPEVPRVFHQPSSGGDTTSGAPAPHRHRESATG